MVFEVAKHLDIWNDIHGEYGQANKAIVGCTNQL